MIADRIKQVREKNKMTQAELAKRIGITRSGVNAWEMGISIPSTQYIVELAQIFNVSTDFLLGVEKTLTIDASGLHESDIIVVQELIEHLRRKNRDADYY